jgi:hypothetical protein
MLFATSKVHIPPEALIPTFDPTSVLKSLTSSIKAPCGAKPVDVFTKSAPD